MPKKTILRFVKIIFLIASFGSLYFVPWVLVLAWIKPLPDTVEEQMKEAINQGFDGMVVYIDKAGTTPQFLAAGYHNKASQQPANPHALFKIASISKLYDAVAVTQLVHQGKLSLDKTLGEYRPDLVGNIENAEQITLKMLLQHRSGIPNFTDTPDYWASPSTSYEENLSLILHQPANFNPNEEYEYCNTNYLLINKIMDDALGYPNFRFKQTSILDPLQLSHTYESIKGIATDRIMSGYHVGYPHDLKGDDIGMVASAQDVGVFLRALNDGTLLTPEEQMIYASIYEFEHAGWVPGYQSFANYYKDQDAVVVHFYNTTDPKLYNWNLAEIYNARIAKLLQQTP